MTTEALGRVVYEAQKIPNLSDTGKRGRGLAARLLVQKQKAEQ
jgi:hypothetical protein